MSSQLNLSDRLSRALLDSPTGLSDNLEEVHQRLDSDVNLAVASELSTAIVSKLTDEKGSEADQAAAVILKVFRHLEFKAEDHSYFFNALFQKMRECIAKNAKKNQVSNVVNIFTALSGLMYSRTEDESTSIVNARVGTIGQAGLHMVSLDLLASAEAGVPKRTDTWCWTALVNLANTRRSAIQMVEDDVHMFIMKHMKEAPKSVWKDGDTDTKGARAFDVATNLAKWQEIAAPLKELGLVEFLAELVNLDNYFGFEATEGLAYLVGRSEDAKESKLLHAEQRNLNIIFDVLRSTLDGFPLRYNINWSVYGRVLAIRALSISDANKSLLRPAIPLLVRVLKEKQDEVESVQLSLEALLELSFSPENKKEIASQEGLTTVLKDLSQKGNSKTKKLAEGVLFACEDDDKPGRLSKQSSSSRMFGSFRGRNKKAEKQPAGHVMISYNWKAQPLAKRTNELLKGNGVQTWIDYEQMNGDTIEQMALAVENSIVFVMCISEHYKESSNCRLEANYAFKNRKPIVPLLMESSYRPDGWLGLLVGNSLYYDFSNHEMVEANASKLLSEIETRAGKPSGQASDAKSHIASESHATHSNVSNGNIIPDPVRGAPTSTTPPERIASMTQDDVGKWLQGKNLESLVRPFAKEGIDGEALFMLYDLYCRSGSECFPVLSNLGMKSAGLKLKFLFALRVECQ